MADTLAFTVCFSNEKSCSAHADLNRWKVGRITSKSLSDYDVIKVTDNAAKSFYFGLNASSLRSRNSEQILINGLYASKLGIKNNSTVSVNLLKTVPICLRAWIEPVTVDDWEILELHAEKVEGSLLDQIRVLWPGQVFPLWVTSGVCIFLRTVAIDPVSQCGILMPLTELIVEPKVNPDTVQENEFSSQQLDTRSNTGTAKPEPHYNAAGSIESESVVKNTAAEAHSGINAECDDLESQPTMLQRIFKIWIIRRFISLVKYLWNLVVHRIIPAITGNFSFLQVTAPMKESNDLPDSLLSTEVLSKIQNFPSRFDLVLRVEDTQLYATGNPLFEHYDQAGYALLDYSQNSLVNNDEDYQIFLVGIQRLPTRGIADAEISDNETAGDVKIAPSEIIVRLFVRSRSKFAMFLCDNNGGRNSSLKVIAKALKLSAVLRMQHKIGITSKVKIQKLSNIPKPVTKNVKTIIFQTMQHVPNDVLQFDFNKSLKEWLSIVSGGENPLPITCGTIFLLPLQQSFQNELENYNDSNIYIRVEKIIDHDGNASSEYYLLTRKDLSSVSIEFILEPMENYVPLDEIDPKIPSESIVGLIPSQNEVISKCLRQCESVYQSLPITHKLCNNVCHPGFVMITGPSGIGKSYLARALLRKLATSSENPAYVRWISCSSFKGKKPETIKKMLQGIVWELEWRQPSALLLDDFDHLVCAGNSTDGDSSPSAVYVLQLAVLFKDVLLKLAQNADGHSKRVIVIATALSEHSIHPVLRPAQGCYVFSKILQLNLPEKTQRKQFLKAVMLKELSINSQSLSKVNFEKIVALTEGYSPKDYEQLLKRALICGRQCSTIGKTVSVKTSDIIKAMNDFVPISLQDAKLNKPKKFSWEDVGGLENVREQLTEKLVWPVKYSQLYQSAGMQLRSGILLYGPPGCGKTLIAGVVANECNLNIISVKGPELLNKYIGASEAAVRELFHRAAAAAPCLLFFDEFDSIAQKRGHDNTGVTDRVVNQFLTHLDGVEPLSGVYVLAATSRPDLIDPAILRPGRLDTHLHCSMPDFDERCRILQCLVKKISLADEINIRVIAAKCENFTGADLRALVYDAQLSALHGEADAKLSLNSSGSSTVPVSSRSISPSSLDMEIDDQYSSNGFNAVTNGIRDESIDSIVVESDVSLTVQDFTNTAAKLARSLQEQNPKSPRVYGSGQYQICYSLSAPDDSHDESKLSADIHAPVADSGIIHFPSLYSKTNTNAPLPESVRSLVDDITTSGNPTYLSVSNKPEMKVILVHSHHFDTVLKSASPSVSASERLRYLAICENFGNNGKSTENGKLDSRIQKRMTLA